MSPRRRKWTIRLIVALVLVGTAGGVWAWLESPGHKVRVLMDRLCDDQPNYVQRLLIKVGFTRTCVSPPTVSHRTVPCRMYVTPSSAPICRTVFVVFLYWYALERAMTLSPERPASLLEISSVIPSTK